MSETAILFLGDIDWPDFCDVRSGLESLGRLSLRGRCPASDRDVGDGRDRSRRCHCGPGVSAAVFATRRRSPFAFGPAMPDRGAAGQLVRGRDSQRPASERRRSAFTGINGTPWPNGSCGDWWKASVRVGACRQRPPTRSGCWQAPGNRRRRARDWSLFRPDVWKWASGCRRRAESADIRPSCCGGVSAGASRARWRRYSRVPTLTATNWSGFAI